MQDAKQKGDLIPPPDRQRISKEAKNRIEWLNSIFFVEQRWDDVSLAVMFRDEVVGRTIGDLIGKKSELHKTRLKIAKAVLES